MPQGTLEVHLVSASGLENTDFLFNMDAYCILTCHNQEKKSKVASGEGSKPKWDETFLFKVTDNVTELKIRIMDKDTFTADDFVGEVRIPLEPVFEEDMVEPTSYNVVKDEKYCGGVRVGLKFTHQRHRETEYSGEEFGGYRESSKEEREEFGE
ncbi:hypothetical protein BUALT_Bualt01G0222900 [Buddleja alternifolia]|uniref:C2 domain-containing protein n=1 Tax=Buddleja alternifolia TaxID=168488 RepID=A0AAV6YBJ9_9LAMI|nr:hypothetical protein BUALT_Bualt01G0222900 [Buddleja alternifolia]